MHARSATEASHGIPHLGLDEGVHDDRGTAACAPHGELEILDGLDARVPDLLELLVGKLGFECLHETRGRLPRGVGDDVQLDGRMRGHGHILAEATS
jgi:hypothetical protein